LHLSGENKVRESAEVEAPATAAAATDFIADPSEPRYCFCQRVAFGRMVACDGEGCQYEWFHFICVGLTEDPQADWYCDTCKAKIEAATKRKSISKTPKRTVESYLSPIKRKINPRKSLSELKRENAIVSPKKESFSPVKVQKTLKQEVSPIKMPKTPKRTSPLKVSKTPKRLSPKKSIKKPLTKSIKSQTPKKNFI
jgi:hypothetical protein